MSLSAPRTTRLHLWTPQVANSLTVSRKDHLSVGRINHMGQAAGRHALSHILRISTQRDARKLFTLSKNSAEM